MRKFVYTMGIISLLLFGLNSCKSKNESKTQDNQAADLVDTAHNSRNSLDWEGLYTGVIPCADCPGINVQITLNKDETYEISYQYIDRKGDPEISSGKFTWDNAGGTIKLDSKDLPPYYKIGENKLFQLDMDGNPITGEHADMYVLTKK